MADYSNGELNQNTNDTKRRKDALLTYAQKYDDWPAAAQNQAEQEA